jgi:penicillin-binding protein 1A
VCGVLVVVFALAMAYPNLPALDTLTDYRPKMPLRIFTADNVLIGEFGEERRTLVHFKDIPDVMKKAVLSIEDDRFYEHGGVDYWGILRAALHNATGGARQGASTITQQVARNFFLSSEQTLKRKAYEALLAWKIEKNLTKDQILEVYMNQIYLGQRAFGFSSAAQIYFGKDLRDISVAEAAMLAGLPKAPSAYNPVVNPKRARTRQQYILQRMHSLGYITTPSSNQAKNEELKIKTDSTAFGVHAEYVAEMARQLVYEQFKEDTYTRGLNVFTTITKADQDAAYLALRRGVMDYERRHPYRGPEKYIEIPSAKGRGRRSHRGRAGRASGFRRHRRRRRAAGRSPTRGDGGAGLGRGNQDHRRRPGVRQGWLSPKAAETRRIRRGALIRVTQDGGSTGRSRRCRKWNRPSCR